MITTPDESTLQTLVNRLAELEQAHAHLQEELQVVKAERAAAGEQATGQARTRTSKSSRRKVLEKGLGVAVATVGAGALLELSGGTALASDPAKPGVFASSTAGTPAVKATGTNGADGVDASSDSGTGVSAKSSSGTGLFAQSSSFNAIHAVGGGTGVSALFAEGGTGFGVFATSDTLSGSGDGVRGSSHGSGNGVTGISALPGGTGNGVVGIGHPGDGVVGFSDSGNAIHGIITPGGTGLAGKFEGNVSMSNNLAVAGTLSSGAGALASSVSGTPAVKATGTSGADGVDASSDSGTAVFAQSGSFNAIHAIGGGGGTSALFAEGGTGFGVFATGNVAIDGVGLTSGVEGHSTSGTGVFATSSSGFGVFAQSGSNIGVFGGSTSGDGVRGVTNTSNAIHGLISAGGTGLAGLFEGNVTVTGTLSKGGGSFKIDHPLDPAHKYLFHSFVESPDMKNIYDGVVTLDANGEAEVRLPTWFDTLNTDFRYQLTAIGASAPDLYIAEEISGNRFTIAGGQAGMKVSWLVTGIRQDAWANTYRIPVEEDKPENEQGSYLHPELYGQSEQKSLVHGR